MNSLLIWLSIGIVTSYATDLHSYQHKLLKVPKTIVKPVGNSLLGQLYTKHKSQADEKQKLSLFPKNVRKFIITENPLDVNQIPTMRSSAFTNRPMAKKFVIHDEVSQTTAFFYREPVSRRPLMKFKKFIIDHTTPRIEKLQIQHAFVNSVRMRKFPSNDESKENYSSESEEQNNEFSNEQIENRSLEKPEEEYDDSIIEKPENDYESSEVNAERSEDTNDKQLRNQQEDGSSKEEVEGDYEINNPRETEINDDNSNDDKADVSEIEKRTNEYVNNSTEKSDNQLNTNMEDSNNKGAEQTNEMNQNDKSEKKNEVYLNAKSGEVINYEESEPDEVNSEQSETQYEKNEEEFDKEFETRGETNSTEKSDIQLNTRTKEFKNTSDEQLVLNTTDFSSKENEDSSSNPGRMTNYEESEHLHYDVKKSKQLETVNEEVNNQTETYIDEEKNEQLIHNIDRSEITSVEQFDSNHKGNVSVTVEKNDTRYTEESINQYNLTQIDVEKATNQPEKSYVELDGQSVKISLEKPEILVDQYEMSGGKESQIINTYTFFEPLSIPNVYNTLNVKNKEGSDKKSEITNDYIFLEMENSDEDYGFTTDSTMLELVNSNELSRKIRRNVMEESENLLEELDQEIGDPFTNQVTLAPTTTQATQTITIDIPISNTTNTLKADNELKSEEIGAILIIAPSSESSEEENDYSEFIFLNAMLSHLAKLKSKNMKEDKAVQTIPSVQEEPISSDVEQPRDKRKVNVIEEENLASTVSGFKFTGKEPQLYSNPAFKNINS